MYPYLLIGGIVLYTVLYAYLPLTGGTVLLYRHGSVFAGPSLWHHQQAVGHSEESVSASVVIMYVYIGIMQLWMI